MIRSRSLLIALLAISGCVDASSDMSEPGGQGGGKSDNPTCARGEPGTLDTCAGIGRVTLTKTSINWQRAVQQPDGKLLVFGLKQTWNGDHPGQYAPFLVRLLANGALDESFEAELPPNVSLENHYTPYAVVVRPDGTILVGGTMSSYNDYNWKLTVVTLSSDGRAITTAPQVLLPVPGDVNATPEKVLPQPDGSYYIIGTLQHPRNYVSSWRAAFAARVGSDGLLDKTWGTNGMTEIPDNDYTTGFGAAVVGESLYVVGSQTAYSTDATLVAKLDAHGAVDPSFSFRSTAGHPTAFTVRDDGSLSIATAGSYSLLDVSATGELLASARYDEARDYPQIAQLASDGTLLTFHDPSLAPQFNHYNADGSVDDAFATDAIELPDTTELAFFYPEAGSIIETTDEWIVVGHRDLDQYADEPELVTFRIWK